jgi:hypothetical protein
LRSPAVFFSSSANAANKYVSGNITASTTWFSTNIYFVTSTVTVLASGKLTVQAGTTVKFGTATTSLVIANTDFSEHRGLQSGREQCNLKEFGLRAS